MVDTSNNVLVEAAQAGDKDAFAALVEKHYGMVHGLTYSKVSDWSVAEDLTQDVFLIVWTNLDKLKHPEAFLVWLRQIARNAALNWIRRKQYRRQLTERNLLESGDAFRVEEDPSGDAARRECLEHIGEALQSLSPKLREAMVIYYIEGHSALASAEALGISVDTMKKRLRLGRASMQRFYEKRSEGELEQLLPHRPKRRIENIVAGLALGPVMPDLGASIASAGPSMWIQDWLDGASASVLKSQASPIVSGALGSAKTALAGAAVVAVSTGAVAVLITTPLGSDEVVSRPAQVRPEMMSVQTSTPAIDSDALSVVQAQNETYILVLEDQFVPKADPVRDGLRKGDRITKVNDLPLSTSIREDPRAFLYGLPGTRVMVTVMRPNANGRGEQERQFEIACPYQPHRFGPIAGDAAS